VRRRWARFLGVALIVINMISFVMVKETEAHGPWGWRLAWRVGHKRQWIACWENKPAISGCVPFCSWKNIIVADPTPNINKPSARLRVNYVLGANCRPRKARDEAALSIETGMYYAADRVGCLEIERVVMRQWRVSYFAFNVHPHVLSGRIPRISEIGSEPPIISTSSLIKFSKLRKSVGENICSLISYQSLLAKSSLAASRYP